MNKQQSLEIIFSLNIYNIETIKKASYKFTNLISFEFMKIDDNLRINILPLHNILLEDLELIAKQFKNEVLDQDLREIVAKETEGVRNLILAQAFSKTDLLNNND